MSSRTTGKPGSATSCGPSMSSYVKTLGAGMEEFPLDSTITPPGWQVSGPTRLSLQSPPEGELARDGVDLPPRTEHSYTPVFQLSLSQRGGALHLFDIGVLGHGFSEVNDMYLGLHGGETGISDLIAVLRAQHNERQTGHRVEVAVSVLVVDEAHLGPEALVRTRDERGHHMGAGIERAPRLQRLLQDYNELVGRADDALFCHRWLLVIIAWCCRKHQAWTSRREGWAREMRSRT